MPVVAGVPMVRLLAGPWDLNDDDGVQLGDHVLDDDAMAAARQQLGMVGPAAITMDCEGCLW